MPTSHPEETPKLNFRLEALGRSFLFPILFYTIFFVLFFSPVLFNGEVLAPFDGILESFSSFFVHKSLWTPFLFSGYPAAADPNFKTWYPFVLIFSYFYQSWNTYIILGYVFAGSFTYGYVFHLTRSRFAALMSGLVFGLSGFMMAHLGHPTLIHEAAWLPLIVWSLDKLREKFSGFWFGAGCLAYCFCLLAGHSQVFTFAVGLGFVYALMAGWSSSRRWSYYGQFAGMVLLGLGLCGVQLLPTLELVGLGERSSLSYAEFISYSLPLYQIPILFFPFVYGGFPRSLYSAHYYGDWNLWELTGYVGYLPWMLAAIGIAVWQNRLHVRIWVTVAVLAFLLALGDGTPLIKLMYVLPGYSMFRAHARHFVELALALSVLTGLGIAAVQKHGPQLRLAWKLVLGGAGVLMACLASFYFLFDRLQENALKKMVVSLDLLPWNNPAVGIPLAVFLLSSAALLVWNRVAPSRPGHTLLMLVLIVDMGSCVWFLDWRYYSPHASVLQSPLHVEKYKELLQEKHQRMIPIQGALASGGEIPVNLSWLWGIPSASGYNQLSLTRYRKLMSMDFRGYVSGQWAVPSNRGLDILAVRYIFLPTQAKFTEQIDGVVWNLLELKSYFGNDCGISMTHTLHLDLPQSFQTTGLGVVSYLACSVAVPDQSEVLRIQLTDDDGTVQETHLLAGRDTSEWAYDCADVQPQVKHRKAKVFEVLSEINRTPPCRANKYVSVLPVQKEIAAKRLTLKWLGKQGALKIDKLSLLNKHTGQSRPIIHMADNVRFRRVEHYGTTEVLENLRAFPRAWLVSQVQTAPAETILQAILTSRLPDGSVFEPERMALVEVPFEDSLGAPDPQARVEIVALNDTVVELETTSASPAFLVLSDVYYPGWRVSIDGRPARLYQTDYVLRGVTIPAGRHTVVFEFKPSVVLYGAGLSGVSLLILGGIAWRTRTARNSRPS